jgi:ParB-like chromosome segregation protein Spo0J
MPVKVTDETRPIGDLRRDPKNARKHPEKQVALIMRSIEEFGFIEKIIVRPNGMLIGGEGRLIAAERLELKQLECRVVSGLTEIQYRRLGLALNKLPDKAQTDEAILSEVLGEIIAAGDDPMDIGFDESEIDRLTGDLKEDALDVVEVKTGPVDDEFWISVRGPLKHQANMLKRLQDASKDLDGVTVDLGTIAMDAL